MDVIRGRGRGRRGRGRGRGVSRRKKSTENKEENLAEEDENEDIPIALLNQEAAVEESHNSIQVVPPIDMEADISQLEAPTFTTLSRGPPEPMLRLSWNHPVNLLGEKVLNPMIHCCDTCLRPVLIYGRMIPCKHVFCLSCAQRDCKACPRCNDKVVRVEQTGLGTVFMCTHGGTRYGNKGCRRTYLSQRDLQAHINHRHVSGQMPVLNALPVQQNKPAPKPEQRLSGGVTVASPFYDASKVKMFEDPDSMSYSSPRSTEVTPILQTTGPRPAVPRPSNLITVPLQEPPPEPFYPVYSGPPPLAAPPPLNVPPPNVPPHGPPPYFPPFDYPPPPTDTSIPPPTQWSGNNPFYG